MRLAGGCVLCYVRKDRCMAGKAAGPIVSTTVSLTCEHVGGYAVECTTCDQTPAALSLACVLWSTRACLARFQVRRGCLRVGLGSRSGGRDLQDVIKCCKLMVTARTLQKVGTRVMVDAWALEAIPPLELDRALVSSRAGPAMGTHVLVRVRRESSCQCTRSERDVSA